MTQETDYYRLAAGFYQCDDLPDNYLELEDDEFHKQLEAIRQAIKARYTPQKVNQLNQLITKANK
jgi:hypothetical protein